MATASATVTCAICYEEVDAATMFKSSPCCPGKYCQNCIKEHVLAKISENEAGDSDNMPCPCMSKTGKSTLTDASVEPFLSDIEKQRLTQLRVVKRVLANKNLCFCPTTNCKGILTRPRGTRKVQCDDCKKFICFSCKSAWSSFHNCTKKSIKERIGATSVANTKLCPACDVIIEKNGGCPIMRCSSCKYEFCWQCSSATISHSHKNKLADVGCTFLELCDNTHKNWGPAPIRPITKALFVITGLTAATVTLVTAPIWVPAVAVRRRLRDRRYDRQRLAAAAARMHAGKGNTQNLKGKAHNLNELRRAEALAKVKSTI